MTATRVQTETDTLTSVSVASAAPSAAPGGGGGGGGGGECNTGPIQCCDKVAPANSDEMSSIISAIGIGTDVLNGLGDGLVGTSCSPIDVLSLGGGVEWYVQRSLSACGRNADYMRFVVTKLLSAATTTIIVSSRLLVWGKGSTHDMRASRGPDQHRMRSHPTLRKYPLPRVTHCLHKYVSRTAALTFRRSQRALLASRRSRSNIAKLYQVSMGSSFPSRTAFRFSLLKLMLSFLGACRAMVMRAGRMLSANSTQTRLDKIKSDGAHLPLLVFDSSY